MNKSQLKILFFMLILAAAPLLFAAGGEGGDLSTLGLGNLDKFGTTLQDIFTGSLVRVILVCCLAGCGIAYAFNKDNEKMKRNIIAIAIGIAIIAAASAIVKAVFDASKN